VVRSVHWGSVWCVLMSVVCELGFLVGYDWVVCLCDIFAYNLFMGFVCFVNGCSWCRVGSVPGNIMCVLWVLWTRACVVG